MKPIISFPLVPVAPADEVYIRRSEGTLVELKDGNVLLAYATHNGVNDNDHAPLVTKLLDREGNPISEEQLVVPPPEGGLNALSAALRRLPDGRIGLLYSHRMSQTVGSRRFLTSSDEGKTWSKEVIAAEGDEENSYKTGCHDRLTVHSSGRLLAPIHCCKDRDDFQIDIQVAYSDDLGDTWKVSELIKLPKVHWLPGSGGPLNYESGCVEPGIAERGDGSLIMTIRTAMGTQFCTESFDRGTTWSGPRSMEVISPTAPANISRIPGTDDLLLLWNSDYTAKATLGGERHTIMACVSTDGGRSWPHASRKILVQDFSRSIDYPSVMYKGDEVWITLRVSAGPKIVEGLTGTFLTRVPLTWFYDHS